MKSSPSRIAVDFFDRGYGIIPRERSKNMIYRKIMERLEKFYHEAGRTALLIDGARQVGKTFIIEEFGRTHYESVVKIDFVKIS